MARCIAGEIVWTTVVCWVLASLVDAAVRVSAMWSVEAFFFRSPVVPSSCRQQYWKLWERHRCPSGWGSSFCWSNICSTLMERPFEASLLSSSLDRLQSGPSGKVGGKDNWEEDEAAELCPRKDCFSERTEYWPDGDWQKMLAFRECSSTLQSSSGEEGGEGEQTRILGLSDGVFGCVFPTWPNCLNPVSSPDQKAWEFPVADMVVGRCIISMSFLQLSLAVPGGRFMKRTLGTISKNTLRTQWGMPWVCGDRWCTFKTKTVIMMESVTKTMVKSRYSPISGITSDVDGMISVISRRKTVRDSNTEIHKVIFSPHCEGK